MRRWVYALAGLSLFVAGVAVGVGLTLTRTAEHPPGPERPGPEGREDMSREAKSSVPSVKDDEAALVGVWIDSNEARLVRFTKGEYGPEAYLLNHHGYDNLDFALEDRSGKRVLVEEYTNTDGDQRNPLYEYRLRGDRLELELLPGAAPVYGEARELKVRGNLAGTWYRVRINKDAEQ